MAALITRLAPGNGYTQSALEEVRLLRSDVPLERTPVVVAASAKVRRKEKFMAVSLNAAG